MASAQILRRRIKTAQNVSKTTRAMQMIAASKLKRAQDATYASRPYVGKLVAIVNTLTKRVENDDSHPYLKSKLSDGKNLVVVVAPDKGLCGSLLTNLVRELISVDKNSLILTIGKKIEKYPARFQKEVIASFPFGTTTPSFQAVYPIVKIIDEYYLKQNIKSVKIIYTNFISIFSQKAVLANLLPIKIDEEKKQDEEKNSYTLFEPNIASILDPILKHFLEMVIYQYLLESFVSEQAARMIAMQNATDNAKEIVQELTLMYNKERQQRITSEIQDISSSLFAYA